MLQGKEVGAKEATAASRSPRRRQQQSIEDLLKARPRNTLAEHSGPRGTLRRVVEGLENDAEKQAFIAKASLDAVLGACPKSMPSLRCGVRCYIGYVDEMQPWGHSYFPPKLNTLLSWSTLFRSEGTWANYVGYVRTACILVGAPVDVFQEPAVKRAKVAIRKRCLFTQREGMFLQAGVVKRLLRWAQKPANCAFSLHAFLFLITYVFLLRLPSEALPLKAGKVGGQACIYVEGDEVVLVLATRRDY